MIGSLAKKILPLVCVVIVAFVAYKPLLSKGYFPMHDDTQPSRIFQMTKALKEGQFPVRVVPDLGYGYGYPIFNFYAPLPYYVGSIAYIISDNIIGSTKAMFLIGFLLATISMYVLGKQIGGVSGGIVASILYTYAPYHGVNLYVRGAVGELYGYGIIPILLLSIVKILEKTNGNNRKGVWVSIGSIALSCIVLSHNILGIITIGFLVVSTMLFAIYSLLIKKNIHTVMPLLFVLILGIGLSAFFTIPAIIESNQTKVQTLIEGTSNFSTHFVLLDQLWSSPWGYAGSAEGRADGMSFMLGKIQIMAGALGILIALWLIKKKTISPVQTYTAVIATVIGLISIFFTLEESKTVWEIIPLMAFIQYPWRFLNIVLVSLAIFAAFLGAFPKKPWNWIAPTVITILCVMLSAKYFTPEYVYEPNLDKYVSKKALNFEISKISHEYLPKDLKTPMTEGEVPKSIFKNTRNLQLIENKNTTTEKKYNMNITSQQAIILNIAYLSGWKAYFNEKSIEIKNNKGLLEINLPKGIGILKLKLENNPMQKAANAISFLSLILVVYVSLFKGKMIWPKSRKSK